MAKLTFDGLNDIIAEFERMEYIPDSVRDDMLEAGAGVMKEKLKSSAEKYQIRDSGQMIDSISVGKIKNHESISVEFRGKRKNGTRNAEVAFLNEYGVPNKQSKRPFVTDGLEEAADPATEAAMKIYEDYINNKK